jgi:hypothetical protein
MSLPLDDMLVEWRRPPEGEPWLLIDAMWSDNRLALSLAEAQLLWEKLGAALAEESRRLAGKDGEE